MGQVTGYHPGGIETADFVIDAGIEQLPEIGTSGLTCFDHLLPLASVTKIANRFKIIGNQMASLQCKYTTVHRTV
jgi:hypothetical protein